MPSDASIYGLLQQQKPMAGPMDQFAQTLQIGHLMDAGSLNALQRQKLETDLAEESAFKAAVPGYLAGSRSMGDLYGASPQRAVQFDKARTEQKKAEGDIAKTDIETQAAKAKYLRDGLAGVTDQMSYDAWRADAGSKGGQVAKSAPAVFDPAWQRQQLMTADKFIEQSTPKFERVDLGGRVQMLDVNPVTNPAIRGTQLDKTATPGDVLTDARAREAAARTGQHYDADRGLIVDTNTGDTRPVTADGKPIGPKPLLPQQAAQAQMLIQGRQDVERARGLLFKADGSVNRENLLNAQSWGVPGISALQTNGVPFTQGRDLRSYILNAVEGKLRLESGAAVPEQEVQRIAQRFVPMAADSDATIKQKLDRLDEYMAGSLALTKLPNAAPQGSAVNTNTARGKIKFLGFE